MSEFKSRHPLYPVWRAMINRCHNPNSKSYRVYGGRGISVCDRWQQSFWDFLEDMGTKPYPSATIERKNVNGNYDKGNCRWASAREQSRNTRFNRLLTFSGKTQCIAEWSEQTGLSQDLIWARKKLGWTDEAALTTSKRQLILTVHGVSKSLSDWAKECGISKHTMYMRVHSYGWTAERAVMPR